MLMDFDAIVENNALTFVPDVQMEGQNSQCIMNTLNTIARLAGFPDFYTLPHSATSTLGWGVGGHECFTPNIDMEVATPVLILPSHCTASKAYGAARTMIT